MPSIHTHVENFEVPVLGGDGRDEVSVAIEFSFLPGAPVTWTDPGHDPEVDFRSARQCGGLPVDRALSSIHRIARSWVMSEEGRRVLVDVAERDIDDRRAA